MVHIPSRSNIALQGMDISNIFLPQSVKSEADDVKYCVGRVGHVLMCFNCLFHFNFEQMFSF